MVAVVFPGQGSQFAGMGKEFLDDDRAKEYFQKAKDIMGFDILEVMTDGSEEDLKQTKVTQPAVFLHSIIKFYSKQSEIQPDAFSGHSLGEITAITAAGGISFEDGLKLVKERAMAMQEACEMQNSTMSAVLGLDDASIMEVLKSTNNEVVAANFNCPGQVVISGSVEGIQIASQKLRDIGAKRVIELKVGGAFHSPFMSPAAKRLDRAIDAIDFAIPTKYIYQNFDAKPSKDPYIISSNLKKQLVSPVQWTNSIKNMVADGHKYFVELGGKGNVLSGLIRKIDRAVETKTF
jgi:[acyl-carrier-protein] S-malonyltransferase